MSGGFTYILASGKNGTLYIGVTADLLRRIHQHRAETGSAFTRRYGVAMLVHYEQYDRIEDAIAREKALKNWHRDWKIKLIESQNPDWRDLYEELAV